MERSNTSPLPLSTVSSSGGLADALQTGSDAPGDLPVLSFDSDRWAERRADVLNLRDMRRIPTVRELHYVKVGTGLSRTNAECRMITTGLTPRKNRL